MKNTTELHRRRALGLTDYPVHRNHPIEDPRPVRYLIVALLCLSAVAALTIIVPALAH